MVARKCLPNRLNLPEQFLKMSLLPMTVSSTVQWSMHYWTWTECQSPKTFSTTDSIAERPNWHIQLTHDRSMNIELNMIVSDSQRQQTQLRCLTNYKKDIVTVLHSDLCLDEWCPSLKSMYPPLEWSLFMETQLGTGETALFCRTLIRRIKKE